jgi:hypothetical protein
MTRYEMQSMYSVTWMIRHYICELKESFGDLLQCVYGGNEDVSIHTRTMYLSPKIEFFVSARIYSLEIYLSINLSILSVYGCTALCWALAAFQILNPIHSR